MPRPVGLSTVGRSIEGPVPSGEPTPPNIRMHTGDAPDTAAAAHTTWAHYADAAAWEDYEMRSRVSSDAVMMPATMPMPVVGEPTAAGASAAPTSTAKAASRPPATAEAEPPCPMAQSPPPAACTSTAAASCVGVCSFLPLCAAASSALPAGRFASVMVAPCMATMLGYLSVRDRVRVMSVSRAWLQSVRRPHLWQSAQWDCGRSERHPSAILPPCDWMRPCLGGLNARYIDLGFLAQYVGAFTRLHHLELGWSDHDTGGGLTTQPSVTASVLRRALQGLRLRSLKVTDLHPLLSEAIFGAPSDSLERVTSDVATHPALWSWSATLDQVRLIFFADHRTFISCIIRCMIAREWTSLTQLELSVYTAIDLTQEQLDALKAFLTRGHLPVIRQFAAKLELETTIEEALTAAVHDAITRGLPTITAVDFDITVRRLQADGAPVVVRSRPTYPLTLTQLRLHALQDDTLTLARLAGSRLQVLQCEGVWALSVVELFELIGAHSLPHLHTLTMTCTAESVLTTTNSSKGVTSRAMEHVRVAEIIRGMSTLTQLNCWCPASSPQEGEEEEAAEAATGSTFWWVECLHLFPSLTHATLHTPFACGARSQLVESVAHAPMLADLLVSGFSLENVHMLAACWSARCHAAAQYAHVAAAMAAAAGSTLVDAERLGSQTPPSVVVGPGGSAMAIFPVHPPPLHTLSLVLSNAPSWLPLSSTIAYLAHLPRLSSLSLERFFEEEEPTEPLMHEAEEDTTGEMQHGPTAVDDDGSAVGVSVAESDAREAERRRVCNHEMCHALGQLPLLHALTKLTIVDDRRLLTNELLSHWCLHFHQLRELQWTHSLVDTPPSSGSASASASLAWLALRLPRLHRLTLLDYPGDRSSALVSLVAQANAAGREPPLDLQLSEEVWTRFSQTPEGIKPKERRDADGTRV